MRRKSSLPFARSVPELLELLTATAPELEGRLRPQMQGLAGAFVKPYLPQRWVFVTERETASLVVEATGSVSAVAGVAAPPDVTVKVAFDRLRIALTTRRREAVPPGPLEVVPHTEKGRTAFQFVRSRLGL